MNSPKRHLITAALPYTNGPIHIGHLAGVYIPADIYARFLRMLGKEVLYICGSDEHGVPITITAKKEGVTPQEIVDKYHQIIKESFKEFGISFDNYSRTSNAIHHKTAADFFEELEGKGKLIKKDSLQLYDAEAKQFLADRFVVGTCPKCDHKESYGDQCEQCGTSHNALDLINPISAITKTKPIKKETFHWYLPLDNYEKWLRSWILETKNKTWKTNVLGQVKSWLDDGLKPRAVTRDLEWGVKVPHPDGKGKVLYVWFDAPIGYISATKEWAEKNNKDWELYWKDKETSLVHFIGKDNIVFHCVIFPSMLKAQGSFIMPTNVPANEFLNLEGAKISTSKNWAVWLHEYLEEFPEKQDVLRYVLTANAPETKDNDFTWKDFQQRNNSELVAIAGNFLNRVVVLTHKYYDGIVPEANHLKEADQEALNQLYEIPKQLKSSIEKFRFREAQQILMNVARLGNKYLADEEPWKKQKEDPEAVKNILFTALQIASGFALMAEPFLPFTSQKMKGLLYDATAKRPTWEQLINKETLLLSGNRIKEPELLFEKIEDEIIEKQLLKLTDQKKMNIQVPPLKETVSFDQFSAMDIRVGTILEAQKVANADKLLELKVDIGLEVRTIVSGIALHFKSDEIIGKKVSVLVNLAPRKIRGVLSNGMLLMSEEDESGKLSLLTPFNMDTPNGSVIR